MIDKLKPCPFCGGIALLEREPETLAMYVECYECLSKTHSVSLGQKAMELWNKRVPNEFNISEDLNDG